MAEMPKYYKIHTYGCTVELEPIYEELEPVRHGAWVPFKSEAAGDIQYCSVCEIGCPHRTDYCPNCGAKMDLEG